MPNAIPATALIDKRSGKPRIVSPRIKKLLRLILSGECKTAKAAAERVGVSADWARASLALPHVQVFISRERHKTIAQGSLRAASRLVELVDGQSEHVSLDASKHLLAIEGISPPERGGTTVNVNVRAGFVIDLSEGQQHAPGAMFDVTPTQVREGESAPDLPDAVPSKRAGS